MNKWANIFFTLCVIVVFSNCQSEETTTNVNHEPKLFSYLDASQTNINFVNQITNTEEFNIFNYRNFYNGGGVAIGDVNNDGLPDIYLTANMGPNKLYINKGNFKFEDISDQAGISSSDKWSTGVTMVDINNDGLLDIYVCNAGHKEGTDQRNNLFINNGDLTFSDLAADYGLDENGYTTHAAFFDYDQDGDLDVYILNNSFIPVNTLNYSNKRDLRAEDWPVKDFLKGGGDKLLRNENGKFVDVSEKSGIYGSLIGFGLGVTVGDIDNDGDLDIYVSNDFFERDYLYVNDGKGGFDELLTKRTRHISHSSMGADMADVNNDGSAEIFVTDMLPDDNYRLKTTSTFDNINLRNLKVKNGFYNQFMHNTLQLNSGIGTFQEISFYSGVAASDWSWGALIFDADNDSRSDVFVCNGILNDVIDQDFIDFFANDVVQKMVLSGDKKEVDSIITKMPSVPLVNKLFRNTGDLKFEDASLEMGIDKKTFSNGAAYADLDNDGDLDLVVNNVNQEAQVLKNNSTNSFVSFSLEYKDSNTKAIGSKVFVYIDDKVLARELIPSRGFQSSMEYKLTIGLGDYDKIDSVAVVWPNGLRMKINDIKLNDLNKVAYSDVSKPILKRKPTSSMFESLKHNLVRHEEDDYTDFFYERNIPMQLSKEGPCAAIGDFNGDSIQDIFIGAAAGFPPKLYQGVKFNSQEEHYFYREVQSDYFKKFKAFEDTCAEFVDVDNDGDLDLLVGSGGNNVTYQKRAFRDRVYVNKDGVFEININALPPNTLNTSCLLPIDYDSDGDMDLFVGSRSVPGEYGVSPGSFIYNNNGRGQFLDVTQQIIPDLAFAGMVTDAKWADILPQKGKEIILVGEWMAPKILSFDGVKFNIIDSNLSKLAGWWQSVLPTDIDKDGDLDLVLGNIGENFYLKADTLNPLFLWINDFDDNGSIEKLITQHHEGKDLPVVVKRDLADQLPQLKKENLLHSEYADKPIQDLFKPEKIKSSIIKKIDHLSSMIAINDGQGNFNFQRMGTENQLSCINTICPIDFDNDGDEDLLIAGNNNYLLPQFSMLDASDGQVLRNDNGVYNEVDYYDTGFLEKGTVREIKAFKQLDKTFILALANNRYITFYELKN